MDEFRWIQMFVCLMLMIQIPVSVNETSMFMKVGDDVTLPCLNVVNEQNNCDGTTWTFTSRNKQTAELITLGQIGENPKTKSDRLSVTANCSLVIKKLTVEEVGQYSCDHHKLREIQTQHTLFHQSKVDLSAITLTEHKETDKVTLSCSVVTYGECHHTVKWLIGGRDVDKESRQIVTSQTDCSATLSFLIYHHIYNSRYNTVKCVVTDNKTGKVQLSTTTQTTTTIMTDASQGGHLNSIQWFIIPAAGLVSLLVIVVVFIRWKRTRAEKNCCCIISIILSSLIDLILLLRPWSSFESQWGLSLNPAETQSAPQTSQDSADPEVSYATISYSKTNNNVRGDDEGDAVTYSTVKAHSSSAAATADPSSLYSTVSFPAT
ncbi:two pore calcium channel protein 1 [Sarotherodon galilaeus]